MDWLEEIEQRYADPRLKQSDAPDVVRDLCRHLRRAWVHQDRLYEALVRMGPAGWVEMIAEHSVARQSREGRYM